MIRTVALLLCAAVAFAVSAAPAPVYKPKSSRAWFTGWDKPVDPSGGCRFEREGDVMTIAVRGKPPGTEGGAENPDCPRLLRDVAGDFDMVVRVGGDFDQANLAGKMGERARRAGVYLAVGEVTHEVGISALSGVPGPTLPDACRCLHSSGPEGLALAGHGHPLGWKTCELPRRLRHEPRVVPDLSQAPLQRPPLE